MNELKNEINESAKIINKIFEDQDYQDLIKIFNKKIKENKTEELEKVINKILFLSK